MHFNIWNINSYCCLFIQSMMDNTTTPMQSNGIGRVYYLGHDFQIYACIIFTTLTDIRFRSDKYTPNALPSLFPHTLRMGHVPIRLPRSRPSSNLVLDKQSSTKTICFSFNPKIPVAAVEKLWFWKNRSHSKIITTKVWPTSRQKSLHKRRIT